MKTHWFPLIRPAIRALFLGGVSSPLGFPSMIIHLSTSDVTSRGPSGFHAVFTQLRSLRPCAVGVGLRSSWHVALPGRFCGWPAGCGATVVFWDLHLQYILQSLAVFYRRYGNCFKKTTIYIYMFFLLGGRFLGKSHVSFRECTSGVGTSNHSYWQKCALEMCHWWISKSRP